MVRRPEQQSQDACCDGENSHGEKHEMHGLEAFLDRAPAMPRERGDVARTLRPDYGEVTPPDAFGVRKLCSPSE
jgi:hypothetical protein